MGKKASASLAGRLTRRSRWLALGLCLSLTPLIFSCYGRFPFTKAIYNFNGDVSNDKVVKSVLMWVFVIVPVYGIAVIGDAVIFNLIEFWTGETLEVTSSGGPNGAEVSLAPANGGREATLTFSRGGKTLAQERFVKTGDGVFEVRDSMGALRGQVVRTPRGGFNLTGADGRVIGAISADSVRAALARAES